LLPKLEHIQIISIIVHKALLSKFKHVLIISIIAHKALPSKLEHVFNKLLFEIVACCGAYST